MLSRTRGCLREAGRGGKGNRAATIFQKYGAKFFLDQVIAKKLKLHGVGSGDTLTPIDTIDTIDTIGAAVQTEHPDLAQQGRPGRHRHAPL